jgi:hypothetical protein
MLAWRDDIQNLIDKTGDERNAFVRRKTVHRRSISAGSTRSVSSGGDLEEDEADAVPFSAQQSIIGQHTQAEPQPRPSPGGRFPSDIQVDRNLQPRAPSSGSSSEVGNDITTASGGTGSYPPYMTDSMAYDHYQNPDQYASQNPYEYNPNRAYQQPAPVPVAAPAPAPAPLLQQTSFFANNPPTDPNQNLYDYQQQQQQQQALPVQQSPILQQRNSTYGDWMAPAAAGAVGGAAAGAIGTEAYHRQQQEQEHQNQLQQPHEIDPLLTPTNAVQPIPERHPDHTAVPLAFIPVAYEPDSLATTPSAVNQPFSGTAEVLPAVSASSNTVTNGGPVAEKPSAVRRQNTDMSVSDLHVPGEYPKVPRM